MLHLENSVRSPQAGNLRSIQQPLVKAERRFEAKQPADEDDHVLQRAMMLLANRSLALLDEAVRRLFVDHVLDEKAAESLARCVEARRIVQAPDQGQQIGERDAHCARATTTPPEGAAPPAACS